MVKRAKIEFLAAFLYFFTGALWLVLPQIVSGGVPGSGLILTSLLLVITTAVLFHLVRNDRLRLERKDAETEGMKAELERQLHTLKDENKVLKQKQEKLKTRNRLSTSLLDNISYKIRTPMNNISGFSQLLKDPNLPWETKANYATIIENSGNQLLEVVSDVLTMSSIVSKNESVLIQEVDINKLVLEMSGIYQPQASNQAVQLISHTGLPNEKSRIYTDKNKLYQIFGNLISNALKFTSKGSVEIGYELKGKDLVFSVKDTGVGIAPEKVANLFERFSLQPEAISREPNGTGLGLAICHSFARMLEGNINVESTPGEGTRFFFTIPYRPVLEKELKLNTNETLYTILIVEDEYLNYLFLETLLSRPNFKLIWAKNGEEAIQYALTRPEINLVLMDIKLPHMDGHESAIQIKKYRQELPIIAQTAYALDTEREAYSEVFDDYLTKPLNLEILRQRVVHFLNCSPSNLP